MNDVVPRIAVLVVNFNGGQRLLRCLETIHRQTLRPLRAIIVDNASCDGSFEAARNAFPEFEFHRLSRNVGFAAANNFAAEIARECDWLALLNPDAYAAPDWLEATLLAARANPGAGSFGARLLMDDDDSRLDGVGDVYHASGLAWREGHGQPAAGRFTEVREIFSACAAAAVFRREAFDRAAGFDEAFFCYMEDVDLGFRLRLLGYGCIYVPQAVVRHTGSAITGRRSDFAVYHGHRNLVWTYFKNMPGALFWACLPLHLLLNVVGIVLCGRPALSGRVDALRQLPVIWRKRQLIQRTRAVPIAALRRSIRFSLLDLFHR